MIKSEHLRLYSPHEVSAGQVCDYYSTNREFLKEFSPVREESFYTQEHQATMLKTQVEDWEAGRGYRFYIALDREDSPVIGSIALSNLVRGAFHSCFLGYQLDGNYINRGLMTEAVKRVVAFGFEELQLHRVEANIIPRNMASRAVAKKCGFVEEGYSRKYLKINGVWEDHIHYVILNEAME